MFFGWRKSRRFERVASIELPPGQWERAWISLRRRDVLGRIALAALAAMTMCAVIRGWDPPFPYRTGYTPRRDIVTAAPFTVADEAATAAQRERARNETRFVYQHDAEPLVQLRAKLRNTLIEVTAAPTFDKVDPKIWKAFQPPLADGEPPSGAIRQEELFEAFRNAFTPQERLDSALDEVFAPLEEHGLLASLDSEKLGTGNQVEIMVYPVGRPDAERPVSVSDVVVGNVLEPLHNRLRKSEAMNPAADALFAWLEPRLKETSTLTLNDQRTKEARDAAANAVPLVTESYSRGQTLADAGRPIEAAQMELLRHEYKAMLDQRPLGRLIARGVAVTGLIFAALLLCGIYMRYHQRGPLASLTRLLTLLLMAIASVAVARWLSADAWRAELVPVLLFGMTMAIVYRRQLALLMAGVVAMVVAMAIGHGLREFLLLLGVTAAAVLSMNRIRTRPKLIHVGLFAGGVAATLYMILGLIDEQPLDLLMVKNAARNAAWALATGFLVTGLLPFIENLFGVLTDLSLLDLGDVAHPLLQELVRRAPSTYNHSITVGSIAEAAADSIRARGLLVRVGAYFHDIGKMLKPGYFAENQGPDDNRHETLVPAMSTLVIIAHIKDGADLARQHRLPQPIIDLIVQHHGTTRVEYFFDRATEQQQADPNGGEVDESTFRYPGPKPQTKEAAVLMLADAVESASRTLVDPTPARIESLVRELAEQRLHGGQFDESGLTLRELRTIEKSMAMSLTSIYHGRIKYPEPRTT